MEILQKQIDLLKTEQAEMLKLIAKLARLVNLKANQAEVNTLNQNIRTLNASVKELSNVIYQLEIEHQHNITEIRNLGKSIETQIARAQNLRETRPFNGLVLGY